MPKILYQNGVRPTDDDQIALALLGGEEKTGSDLTDGPAATRTGRAFKPEQLSIHETPFEQVPRTKYAPAPGPLLSTQKSANLPTKRYAFEYRGVQTRSSPHASQSADKTKREVDVLETKHATTAAPLVPVHRETQPLTGKPMEKNLDLASAGKTGLLHKLNFFAKK